MSTVMKRTSSAAAGITPLRRTSTMESSCTKLMELSSAFGQHSFDDVVDFLKAHVFDCVLEIHKMKRLSLDDGNVYINCPPAAELGDNHGGEVLRTISENKENDGSHITCRKEYIVLDMGPSSNATEEKDVHTYEVHLQHIGSKGAYDELIDSFELTAPDWA